ncbi:MAG: DUF4136 domain-containing protein [Cyclobacteriaceae bacterium]|nr:DUF4136 domain-containing protein [Cyclobacteriaceae bacterium]
MKSSIILAMALLAMASCSTVQFHSEKDRDVDFSKYKTMSFYGWTEQSDKILNRFDKERIERAFTEEFEKRGLDKTDRNGDIVMSLFIVVDQKTGTTAYTSHYGAGGPYGYYGGFGYGAAWGWGMGYNTTSYSEYDYYVGTLVCDVFDSETKKLIWQGTISGEIDENPKNRERNIPRLVKELMKRFPVDPLQQ